MARHIDTSRAVDHRANHSYSGLFGVELSGTKTSSLGLSLPTTPDINARASAVRAHTANAASFELWDAIAKRELVKLQAKGRPDEKQFFPWEHAELEDSAIALAQQGLAEVMRQRKEAIAGGSPREEINGAAGAPEIFELRQFEKPQAQVGAPGQASAVTRVG